MKRLVVASWLLISLAAFSADWKLEKDEDGIQVYTRSVSGSSIKEFKAFANIEADRIAIARVLTRVTNFINWMPDVTESKVLKIVNSRYRIIYYRVDLPWPADDRDLVLDLTIDHDENKGETIISVDSNLNELEEQYGVVRMKRAEGFWKLTSKGDHTEVHYQFLGEPGGSLPTWLINMFIVENPYETIQALREKVE